MNGLERLLSLDRLPFSGRVGFLGHHASVDRNGRHAVGLLSRRSGIRLDRLFSPEHGFTGTGAAGESIGDSRHAGSGLTIHSLYGEHRTPPPEWLEGLDALVVDLQDLGVRCYTYASTLHNTLRACAASGLPVWVLDRPTPNDGVVDGPALDPELRSFVGQVDLPLVYGFGQGRLAEFLWTSDPELAGLDLHVVAADPDDGRNWIPPSPAIVSRESARLYPLTVWCEAVPEVWVDRGGPRSFHVWSMPDLPAKELAESWRPVGMEVRAVDCATPNGDQPGLAFRVVDPARFKPVRCAVELLCGLRDRLGSERLFRAPGARPEFFDKLMGTRTVREAIQAGRDPAAIRQAWPTV